MRIRFVAATAASAIAASASLLAGPAYAAKKLDACKVLTSADITAVFDDGPLDPGPTPDTPSDPTSSKCVWRQSSHSAPASLSADVTLTPLKGKVNYSKISGDGITPLTKQQLKDIGGDSGYVWISTRSQGSGAIAVVKGKTKIYISAGYSGIVPVPTVDAAGFLTLAEKVTKQV